MSKNKLHKTLLDDLDSVCTNIASVKSKTLNEKAESVFQLKIRGHSKFKGNPLYELLMRRFRSPVEAWHELGITKATLYNWVNKGCIPETKRQSVINKGFDPDTLKRL